MQQKNVPKFLNDRKRPEFPKRAIITAGMPYGNKDLHFGHIGGVFVQADSFANFLRDRIGKENVIFVSGTDCYGSPIVEYHRNAVEKNEYSGNLQEFIEYNHKRQKDTLKAYKVEPDLFAASGMEPHRTIHEKLGKWILEKLHKNGYLTKMTTPQFYDIEHETFLNGRQVLGKCPVHNCKSEKAYADECDLGHQYEPKEVLNPKSTLSGKTPEMRDVTNWYLNLPVFREQIEEWLKNERKVPGCRHYVISYMLEFFEPPIIHITKKQLEALEEVRDKLPQHEQKEGRGKSIQLVFEKKSLFITDSRLI